MPENTSEPETLHQLVTKKTDDGKNRKVVGYSVSSYAGVLSALEKAKLISSGIGSGSGVMGVRRIDFSKIADMVYDNSGFSSDRKSGIWKMALTFHGAAPVKYTVDAWYDIIKFQNDNERRAKDMDALTKSCPYYLSQEALNVTTQEDFLAGAYIDLHGLGVKYFNHFYANGGTFYDDTIVDKLVYGGCMVAQVVFPQKNTYKLVKILGKSSISNHATISLTSSLLACNGWEDLGVNIRVTQNGSNPVIFMPNGTDYQHPCQGETYYYSTGKINNFNKTVFKEKWLNYSVLGATSDKEVNLQMELPSMTECYVRLYVPSIFKDDALKIIGTPPNDFIFQDYGEANYVQGTSVEYAGDVASIMAGVVNKWATVGQTTSMGSNTNKICWSMDASVRPHQYKRGCGTTFVSASEPAPFTPKFGHPKNINVADCSSFICLVLWDSGIVRDDINVVPAWGTGELCAPSIAGKINNYLKPIYEAKYIDLVDENQVQVGDILCITKEERLRFHGDDYSGGHAAIACPEGDNKWTVEIGSTKNSEGTKKKGYKYSYYKHIIRIVEKQTT